MRRPLAALLLAMAACGKPDSGPGGKSMTTYQDPKGLFSCQAPPDWRVLEDQGGAQRVSFFGPPAGPAPFSVSISIYYYPKSGSAFASPQDYAAAQALSGGTTTPLITRARKDGEAFGFTTSRESRKLHSSGTELREELTVLIPAKNGFFALVHAAPRASTVETRPVFDGLVEGFQTAH